jgi:hypothetical protein
MLTVAPIGITKFVISLLIFRLSSAVLIVKGIVAALLDDIKAKKSVLLILLKMTKYFHLIEVSK